LLVLAIHPGEIVAMDIIIIISTTTATAPATGAFDAMS
jgi:hypothetical protein